MHALRHCCGTRVNGGTRDLLVLERHLRHWSTQTSEMYAHVAHGDYRKGVTALEQNGAS